MDCINSTGKLQGFTAIQHNGFSSLRCGGGTGPGDRAASLSSLCAGKLRRSGSDFSLAVPHPPVACIALFKRQLATIRKLATLTVDQTDRLHVCVGRHGCRDCSKPMLLACLLACLSDCPHLDGPPSPPPLLPAPCGLLLLLVRLVAWQCYQLGHRRASFCCTMTAGDRWQ